MSNIDSHFRLRRGLFPMICKFYTFRKGERSPVPPLRELLLLDGLNRNLWSVADSSVCLRGVALCLVVRILLGGGVRWLREQLPHARSVETVGVERVEVGVRIRRAQLRPTQPTEVAVCKYILIQNMLLVKLKVKRKCVRLLAVVGGHLVAAGELLHINPAMRTLFVFCSIHSSESYTWRMAPVLGISI